MNILMINGTMRKGSTYHVGKMLIDKIATKEDQVIELFLPKDMPEFCRGCGRCIMEDETKCFDYLMYMKRLTGLIDKANLLILTSPVHVMHVTGAMKSMLDHYGYRFMVHRPGASMFRKQAVCIATAAGGGVRSTLKDMKISLQFWGAARVYTYGMSVASLGWDGVSADKKERIDRDLSKLVLKISKDPDGVNPGIKTRALFYIMRNFHKKGMSPVDDNYWKEMGWLGKERPWKLLKKEEL